MPKDESADAPCKKLWYLATLFASVICFHTGTSYFEELLIKSYNFPHASFLVLCMFFIYLVLYAVSVSIIGQEQAGARLVLTFDRSHYQDVAGICILYAISNTLSKVALNYVSIPFGMVFKSCKLVAVMLASRFILGKRYSLDEYLIALGFVTGMVGRRASTRPREGKTGLGQGAPDLQGVSSPTRAPPSETAPGSQARSPAARRTAHRGAVGAQAVLLRAVKEMKTWGRRGGLLEKQASDQSLLVGHLPGVRVLTSWTPRSSLRPSIRFFASIRLPACPLSCLLPPPPSPSRPLPPSLPSPPLPPSLAPSLSLSLRLSPSPSLPAPSSLPSLSSPPLPPPSPPLQAFFANSDWHGTLAGSDAELLSGAVLLSVALFCDSVWTRTETRKETRTDTQTETQMETRIVETRRWRRGARLG